MGWKNTVLSQAEFHTTKTLNPAVMGGKAGNYQIRHLKWNGGLADGVEVIEVDNGRLKYEVVPTRGFGIRRVTCDRMEFKWDSPVRGPVHPQFVPLAEPSGLGWLDGFDELLVRCGLESNGAPEFDEQGKLKYPLHGKIANKPANHVEVEVNDETGEVRLSATVYEIRFHILKLQLTSTITTLPGEPILRIRDEIKNLSATEAGFQMLYHINYGHPLLDAGSRVIAPVKTLVPRNAHAAAGLKKWDHYSAPELGFEEQVYFFDLHANDAGKTQVLLRNAHGTHGASLVYPVAQLPCFTVWKDTAALADGYVTGLEPGTNYPNPRSFEEQQGRVVKLPPQGKQVLELEMHFHTRDKEVSAAEAAIAKIQAGRKPKIFDQPQPSWCAS